MTEHNIRRSAVVGLAVTLVLILMAWAVGGLKIFHRTYSVGAVFADASDVGTGDPVRVAGVDVGKVTAVQRLPNSVRMTLEINKGIHLSEGTGASIRLRTLLGKKFVDLSDPGSGPQLPSRAVIPMSRTRAAVGVDEVQWQKGHRYLFEGIAAVRAQIPGLVCLMAGEGPLRRDLEAEVRRLGLGTECQFRGVMDPGVAGSGSIPVPEILFPGFPQHKRRRT